MYTLSKDNKRIWQTILITTVLVTFFCFTAQASCPNMARYWEKTLQRKGFSTDTPGQIIEAAKSESYFVRYIALRLLTDRTGKEALNDPHVKVRWTAAHLLGTLGDKSGSECMQLDFAELVPRNGAPKYTETPNPQTTGNFDLTDWLDKYPNVGTVNCYDMGKAVVVFANALGSSAFYHYVTPFGYNNCIWPIGCSWTNNPFYSHPDFYDDPLVDGDAADDGIHNNHTGRSRFGRHGFSVKNSYIYDASAGIVDVDSNPDEGPVTHRLLDGRDTWDSSYKDRVIDDNPASSPGTPFPCNFDVQ